MEEIVKKEEVVEVETPSENSKQAKKEAKKKAKEEKKKKRQEKIKKEGNSFFADFKKFISKGNIIDLAVAVVIGAAFNSIVTELVNSIIMPLISLITGGASVEDWKWVITPATETTAEVAVSYGLFIQAIINFLIIALTIFIVLRILVNSQRGLSNWSKKLKKQFKHQSEEAVAPVEAPAPVKIESQEDILKDIRTLLTNLTAQSNENKLEPAQIEKADEKQTELKS